MAGQHERPCLRPEAKEVLLGWEGGAEVVRRFVDRGPFRKIAKMQIDVCEVTVRFTQGLAILGITLE